MVRKSFLVLCLFTIAFMAATPAFAGEGDAPASGGHGFWLWIAAGFSMAFASGLCGLAQGRATASACEGIARNPSAAGAIRTSMIIGLALIESLALYTLVIIFAKMG